MLSFTNEPEEGLKKDTDFAVYDVLWSVFAW